MKIELEFGPCDVVWYFNTAECKVMSAKVKGARVIPTGISKDEKGEDVLDGCVALYETFDGPILTDKECFASKEECLEWFRKYFQ